MPALRVLVAAGEHRGPSPEHALLRCVRVEGERVPRHLDAAAATCRRLTERRTRWRGGECGIQILCVCMCVARGDLDGERDVGVSLVEGGEGALHVALADEAVRSLRAGHEVRAHLGRPRAAKSSSPRAPPCLFHR